MRAPTRASSYVNCGPELTSDGARGRQTGCGRLAIAAHRGCSPSGQAKRGDPSMNRSIRHIPTTQRGLSGLIRAAIVAVAFSPSAWAQEPVPKSISPLPEVRFFESQPTVGAPLSPAYRASPQLAAASAARPGGPVPRARAASPPVPAAQSALQSPLTADAREPRSPPSCDTLSRATRQKCVERTAP
jgi:hypothetical protein